MRMLKMVVRSAMPLLFVLVLALITGLNAVGQTTASETLTAGPAVLVHPQPGPETGIGAAPAESVFRPTMGEAAYQRAKREAASYIGKKPDATANIGAQSLGVFFEAADRTLAKDRLKTWNPSDVNAAVSPNFIVEVTNSAFVVYDRTGYKKKKVAMSTFMGDINADQCDPMVLYDPAWNRFVVTCIRHDVINNQHFINIAISQTGDPTKLWYVYRLAVFGDGRLWDYPHTGQTQDAIIVTGNVFLNGTFQGAGMFCVAKARLYNGLGFSVPLYLGLSGTLTPPNVLDQDPDAWLLFNQPGTSNVGLYKLHNGAYAFSQQLTGPFNVNTGATYNVPPSAKQPGTTALIDTLDTRFVNWPTQVGGILYATHTVNLVGYAAPKAYRIDTASMTVTDSKFFFQSSTSYDFNAHIAASPTGVVGVTWCSTDPAAAQNCRINTSGATSVSGLPGTIYAVGANSVTYTTGFRFGDYSSIQLDPGTNNVFWGANEYFKTTANWGTRIFQLTVP